MVGVNEEDLADISVEVIARVCGVDVRDLGVGVLDIAERNVLGANFDLAPCITRPRGCR
jgi:hypothetical protein